MGVAIGISTFRHYVEFFDSKQSFGDGYEDAWPTIGGVLIGVLILIFLGFAAFFFVKSDEMKDKLEMPLSCLIGGIFGAGLAISGM